MKISQVAIQLYTLREHCKTAADLAETCKKVRAIGYEAVQASGVGPIPEAEIAKIIKDAGLILCATHENGQKILDETDAIIERMNKLGCKLTAYPYPAGVDFTSRASIDEVVKKLDAAGAKMRKAGLTLGYHNHGIEFARVPGTDQTFFDYVFANTSPENVVAEPDTYWVQFGGADPVYWANKLAGRMPFIHLKDYTFNAKENKPMFCEIGSGNLDFKAIIAAAEKGGCKWFIVEQDTTPGCPFESIKKSFDYIKQNLVS